MQDRVKKLLFDNKKEFALIAALVCLVLACFHKTVFLWQPISRAYLLARRDVLFHPYFTTGASGYDESVYLHQIPYYHLVASYWQQFQMPLWNSFSGWGMPLIGDIESTVFSPLRLLFTLNPSFYMLNLLLVLEVALATCGTYLVARHLSIGRGASFLAAVSYGLCPYILYFLELLPGTSSALLPWVFLAFVRMSLHPSIASAVVSACACTVFIASGHPEASFVGIAFSTLFLLASGWSAGKLAGSFKWTAAIAGIALLLSAPIIIPFLEYLLGADCYKFSHHGNNSVPIAALFINLLQPSYHGASPYLGVFAFSFFLLGALCARESKHALSVLISVVCAFLFATRPLFFQTIFDICHASLIPGTYCIPPFLLLFALLSAFGFDSLFAERDSSGWKKIFLGGLVLTCSVPALLKLFGYPFEAGNFDDGVANMAFNSRAWILTIVLSVLAAVVVFARLRFKFPAAFASLLLIAMTILSQSNVNKLSMPISPEFRFDAPEPLTFLKQKNERVLALGFDLLSPNGNFTYRIPSIGTHSLMQPARYKDFIVAAGAKSTTFNTVIDKLPLSRMLDFAGIKYVMSLTPVYAASDSPPQGPAWKSQEPVNFQVRQIRLVGSEGNYDANNASVVGKLTFEVSKESPKRFLYSPVILGESGNTLWYGGLYPVSPEGSNLPTVDLAAIVPKDLPLNARFRAGFQIFDCDRTEFLGLDARSKTRHAGPVVIVAEFTRSASQPESGNTTYRLVSESGPQRIRLYENRRSLGRAYFMRNVRQAKTKEEALRIVSSEQFDGLREVVIEDDTKTPGSPSQVPANGLPVPVTSESPNQVEMQLDCPHDGYLVLTDIFYPGWKARVDGVEAEIKRANFLFRAVKLAAGRHKVVFSYEPLAMQVSLFLFALGAAVSLLCICSRFAKKENQQ